MKVLQIGKYFYPERGGIETYLYNLCKGLKPKVKCLDILVSNTTPSTVIDNYDGLDLIRSGRWDKVFSTPFCPSFFKYIKKDYYDIIHVHLPNPMAILACLYLKPKSKFVVSYHSDIIKQKFLFSLYKSYIMKFLSKTDRIIVATPNHITSSQVLKKYWKKCRVVHYGIDLDEYEILDNVEMRTVNELKSKVGKGFPIVLFVGRLVYYKGLEYLIQAIENLPVTLVIAGNGPYYSTMKMYQEKMDNIYFAGEVTEQRLKHLYNACDIFCLPSISRAEAFGIVQLEAMACGKPVISTNLESGVPYVNEHLKTGLVIEPKNVNQIRESIMYLINNPSALKTFGKNGYMRAKNEFSLENMVESTYNVYKEIMEED